MKKKLCSKRQEGNFNMTLREKRCLFTRLICEHVLWLIAMGYEVAFDEVTEHITKKDPTSDHMKNSLHHIGLAGDLNLYKDGVYLDKTEDHEVSGKVWEQRHPLCRWGGRFGDGNHYSIEHQGRK